MSQIRKGALLSYISIFLTNAVGLLLTPFIIKSLGSGEYGLYTLIGAFVGYMSVLDLGLNNTIIRFLAKYRTEKDKIGEENFLAMTMGVYVIISILISLIGVVLYFNLETFFSGSLTIEEVEKAKTMFIILIFNIAISLPGGSFTAICSGYEYYVFPKTVNIIRYIIRTILVVALLLLGGDAIGIVVLDTVLNLVVIAVIGFFVFRKIKVKYVFHKYEHSLLKEIFSYSIWVFVLALISEFQWRGGQIILGKISNTTFVAIYAVGVLLGTYYGAFSSAISSVLLPSATRMIYSNASGRELTIMMVKIGRVILLVLLLVLGGFILFGKQFVVLWVGETFVDSWYIALIIMCAYTPRLIQSFANLILDARGLFAFKGIVYFVFLVSGSIVGAIFVKEFGIISLALGTSLGWVIAQVIMNIYYSNVVKLDIWLFFKQISLKIIPSFIFVMVIGFFILKIAGNGWLNFAVKCGIYGIVYISIMYFYGMNTSEKTILTNLFLKNRKNED